jgi:PAS domain S-box-containing protein
MPPQNARAWRRMNFQTALSAAGALVVIVMATFQVYDILRRVDMLLATSHQSYERLARTLAEQTRSTLQAVDVVLADTASSRPLLGASRARGSKSLRSRMLAVPQIANLLVIGPRGEVIVSGLKPSFAAGWIAQQPFFRVQRDRRSAGLFVSDAYPAPGSASGTIALSRRIEDERGRFQGVVVAWMDLGHFLRFYQAIDLGAGSAIVLFRPGGGLLAGYPAGALDTPSRLAEQALLSDLLKDVSKQAWLRRSPVDGEERLFAVQPAGDFPLAVGLSITKSAVLDPWRAQVMHSTVRTTLLCLSVIALVWLAVRHLRRSERAESQLRVQTALLDELFESAPEAIVMLDLDQRVTRFKREFTHMFGYDADRVGGRMLDTLIVPEELRPDWQRLARSVREGRHTSLATERMRSDGTRLHVSELGAPILGSSGQIGSYAIYRDLSEQRLADAERDKLESRLRQAVKLETIGTMAGGIAHDFNNILAAILGYGDMARNAAAQGSTLRRYLGHVLTAAHRGKALIDQILTYSRSSRGHRTAVNMDEAVEETLDLVRVSLPQNIELEAALSARGAAVIADPTHLHQVIMNLCRNAEYAMPVGGKLTVALDALDTKRDEKLSHGLLQAGRYVRLRVADTGMGMSADVSARIFEPFFTTRDSGAGTGLGLAVVQGIVSDLGGGIDVLTGPGCGSRFDIYLPRSDAEAITQADEALPLPRGSGERILLVEDEKALMLLTEEMLAALNYEPAGFTSPAEALAEFRNDPARFDAVVLDQLMPGMAGTELARQMRQVRTDVPVLLISGYTGPVLSEQALSAGIERILTKPLDLRQIAEALSQMLSAQTAL